jgi:hypothetical protein
LSCTVSIVFDYNGTTFISSDLFHFFSLPLDSVGDLKVTQEFTSAAEAAGKRDKNDS